MSWTRGWWSPASPLSGSSGRAHMSPAWVRLAEAMSGFAAMTGEPDGPPTLPSLALADGIAGLATTFAIMMALGERERTGRGRWWTWPLSNRS